MLNSQNLQKQPPKIFQTGRGGGSRAWQADPGSAFAKALAKLSNGYTGTLEKRKKYQQIISFCRKQLFSSINVKT